MNKQRRKDIAAVIEALAKIGPLIEDARDAIETIRDEEQEYYDVMPEGIQQSDRGYTAEAAISELDDALSALEDFDVESITASLETAAE